MDKKHQNLTKKERKELRQQEKQEENLREQKRIAQKRLLKRVTLWLSAVLGLSGAVFVMIKLVSESPSTQTSLQTTAVPASGWFKGSKEAKVVLIEYSDFQCPACRNQYMSLKKLNEEFGHQMRFIYRHFPLEQHANAKLAAHAAEAAGRQGKFWEMHDKMFETQSEWANQRNAEDSFIEYAHTFHLSVEQFKNDLHSTEVKQKVESDFQEGLRSGVDATPTFFLDGKKILPRSYDEFRNLVKEVIKNNS